MDSISEARLAEVHPQLAAKIQTMATMLDLEWVGCFTLHVTQGFRTWAQQHALYLQGRAELTDVNACRANCGLAALPPDQNRRVTKADAGYSWHNFGLAVDVAPFRGTFPLWDDANPSWARIVAVGESLGLRSGISWGDEPHFQLTGRFPVTPDDEVRLLFAQANANGSGTQAVWNAAQLTTI